MLDKDAKCFRTQDIHLAVFLKTKDVKLVVINSLGSFRAEFVFEPVCDELLNEWLTTEALAPVRTTISEFRHLRKTAREVEAGLCGGKQ